MWGICEGSNPKEIPREISYYYLCKEFKCLPGAGGLLDQDPHLVEAFILCMQIEGDYQEYQQKLEEQKAKHKKRLQEQQGRD